jgi:broad-specificity NMP kinase
MPNILITGTPGTGKTTLASAVATRSGLQHLELSKLIQEKDLHDGRDEEFDTFIMNDDKVLDYMEDELKIHTARNFIVDFHSSEFFPERWFDLVIVLRVGNDTLFPRLVARYDLISIASKRKSQLFDFAEGVLTFYIFHAARGRPFSTKAYVLQMFIGVLALFVAYLLNFMPFSFVQRLQRKKGD